MSVSVYAAVVPAGGVAAAKNPVSGGNMPSFTSSVYALVSGSVNSTVGQESVFNPLELAIPGGTTVLVYGPDSGGAYYVIAAPPVGTFAPFRQ